jgi:hypothetical protein
MKRTRRNHWSKISAWMVMFHTQWSHTSQLRRVWYVTVKHVFKRLHTHEISCLYVTLSCTELTRGFPMTTLRSHYFRLCNVRNVTRSTSQMFIESIKRNLKINRGFLGCLLWVDEAKANIKPIYRGTGRPKDKDEVNKREVCECEGWVWDLDAIGAPSRLRTIRKAAV